MPSDEEIGYGKPPIRSRFRKGQSGNPKGRAVGSTNLKTDLDQELHEMIMVREGERAIKISKQRAIVRDLIDRTLDGDARAATTLTKMIFRVLPLTDGTGSGDDSLDADDVEILEGFRERLLAGANEAPVAAAPAEPNESRPAGAEDSDDVADAEDPEDGGGAS